MDAELELDSIVTRARRGDETAMHDLVLRYRERLAGFFRSLGFDRGRAEELAQDTLTRVYQKLDRYEPRGTFEAWLFSVGRNLAIDLLRRERRFRPQPMGEQQDLYGDHLRRGGREFLRPGERMERDETAALVRGALAKVPPVFRETLVLADLEELPYEQIAARLRTTIGTVKSRVFRGRAALAAAIARTESRARIAPMVA